MSSNRISRIEEEDRKLLARKNGSLKPSPLFPDFTVVNDYGENFTPARAIRSESSLPMSANSPLPTPSIAPAASIPTRTASPVLEVGLSKRKTTVIPRSTTGGTPSVLSSAEFEPNEWQREKQWNRLHVAMCSRAENWRVKLLSESNPSMNLEKDSEGNTPLHVGLQSKADVTVLILLGRSAIRTANHEGEFPLHIACEHTAPFRVIADLIEAYPEAIKAQTNTYLQTPIHYLVNSKSATLSVTELCLEKCPEAAKRRDKMGRTPLMLAIANGTPESILKVIYDAFPPAAGFQPTEDVSSIELADGAHDHRQLGSEEGCTQISEPMTANFQAGIEEGRRIEEQLKLYRPHGFRLRHQYNILHTAVTKGAPLDLVRLMLDSNSRLTLEKTIEGNCPLMEGLVSGASEDILHVVLDACEKSCQILNNNNECALHIAVQKASPDLVRRILTANPEATMFQTLKEDEMPLHRLMASRYCDELVHEVLSKYRKAARVRDRFGRTPLHVAVNNQAPVETIMAVVEAFPDALGIEDFHLRTPLDDAEFMDTLPERFFRYEATVKQRGCFVNDVLKKFKPRSMHVNQGWNALHVALSEGASPDKIDILLQSSPNMARKQNEAGNFPLCEGLLGQANEQSLVDVLGAFPEACRTPNNNGEYALHHAARANSLLIIDCILGSDHAARAAADVASIISKSMPLHILVGQTNHRVQVDSIRKLATHKSIRERDGNGNTPLHIAIKNNLQRDEILYLLLEFPNAAGISDNEGHLPLHSAIRNQLSEELLLNLLKGYPDAVRMKYGEEGYLPLHLAMKYRAGADFTAALIKENKKAASITTRNGFTPLSLALTYGAEYDSVAAILRLHPEACKIRDSENMVPLHIAMMRGVAQTIVMTLLEVNPDALNYVNKQGRTPFHSGIVPAIHILQERYPSHFQSKEIGGGFLPPKSLTKDNLGTGRNPLQDLKSILANLEEMLQSYREVAEQRDGSGNLPLLQFCMVFNYSVIRLLPSDRLESARAITQTLEKLYRAFPAAAESTGPFVGSPINVLVGECCMATSVEQLKDQQTTRRLRILLQNARDGRALQPMCKFDNEVSLYAFFLLFHENDSGPTNGRNHNELVLDLNKDVIKGWCVLDMLCSFDTPDSAEILLQILRDQKTKLENENEIFQIVDEDGMTIIEFVSLTSVSDLVRTKVADRAKLVYTSHDLRRWGQEYGRFLKRYRLEMRPKHVSETCVVVFGTEAIKEDDGRMKENPVALKFMCSRETFLREVKKRPVADKEASSEFIVPIKASFSQTGNDEFDCKKVDLQAELEPYKDSIKLKGANLKYVIVMDCGAGYDLHDFISHQNVAGKDVLAVSSILKNIALCLKYLNETCGIIHGDVKARNFVAKGLGFIGFAAIDLDNSATIGRETAGQKRTSSGYLPPEQAAVEAFERSKNASDHGVKTLPVIASSQYDKWSFGVLMYFLCTGKQLFNVDTKEDVDDDDLHRICDWDNDLKKEKLSKVDSKWPRTLLDSLLQKDPANRPENWNVVIDELNRVTSSTDNVLYDTIVIFHSAPLVHISVDGDICPIPQLDFDKESDMLHGALRDAERVGCTIDVILETGSLDRLHAFMAQQMSRVLHFSGHGTLHYMAWEDEGGRLKQLNRRDLERQIEGIGGFVQCVFISACHSQWVAEAFVKAGVPHAICCPVDEKLQDIAASEFTRNFYRQLACKSTVKQAFLMAKKAVTDSPYLNNGKLEARKFLLLPEVPVDSDHHDVQVFFACDSRPIQNDASRTLMVGVPRYRELLVGRNVLKYSILSNLSPKSTTSTDVVRVWGPEGMGKTALIADVCNHIRLRPRSPPQLDYIFWFPPTGQVIDDPLYHCIYSVVQLSIECSSQASVGEDAQISQLREAFAEMAHQKSLLLVIDLRELKQNDREPTETVQESIAQLLQISFAKYFKVILIGEDPPVATNSDLREEPIPVSELDADAAITLFAHRVRDDLRRIYPILNTRSGLTDRLLEPPVGVDVSDEELDEREVEVLDRYLGNGKPGKCCDIARNITTEQVDEMLQDRWWKTAMLRPIGTGCADVADPLVQNDEDDDTPEFMD